MAHDSRKLQPAIEGLESRRQLSALVNLSSYFIVNASSGRVLDDPSSSPANQTLIQQYQLNGGPNQQWEILSQNWIQKVFIVNNVAGGDALDDPSGSTADGTNIQLFHGNGGTNEQWQFTLLGDGNYEIMNMASRKVLTDNGTYTANHTPIQQDAWSGGANSNQQWIVLRSGSQYPDSFPGWNLPYITNAASGKVLDDPSGSTANQTLIQQYPLNGGTNQQWTSVTMMDYSLPAVPFQTPLGVYDRVR